MADITQREKESQQTIKQLEKKIAEQTEKLESLEVLHNNVQKYKKRYKDEMFKNQILEQSLSEKDSQVRKLDYQIKEYCEELYFEKEKVSGEGTALALTRAQQSSFSLANDPNEL